MSPRFRGTGFVKSGSVISTPKLNFSDRPEEKHKTAMVKEKQTKEKDFQKNLGALDPSGTTHRSNTGEQHHKALNVDNKDIPDGEITAMPNPIPDTGIHTKDSDSLITLHHPSHTSHLTHPDTPPVPIMTTSTALVSLPTTSEQLPASITVTSLPVLDPTPIYPLTIYSRPMSSSGSPAASPTTSHPFYLSTIAITFIAVGVTGVLLGVCIIIRTCIRPGHRSHPTPSLPILGSGFDGSEKNAMDDSPLFGGKERLSPPLGNDGSLWTWTQYSRPTPTTSEPGQPNDTSQLPTLPAEAFNPYSSERAKHDYIFTDHLHESAGVPRQPNQLHRAITRATSRLSTVSLSHPIGLSSVAEPSLTADGHEVLKRNKSKAVLRRSRSSSGLKEKLRLSLNLRNSQGLAYDGADVLSPNTQAHSSPRSPEIVHVAIGSAIPANAGRSRIKSTYYTPGLYPRMSTAPVSSPSNSLDSEKNVQSFSLNQPVQKSDSRKDRETRALTAALGLASPSPSPICPPPSSSDGSPRMAAPPNGQGLKRSISKHSNANDCYNGLGGAMSPSMDTHSALGNLMLMEFPSLATLSSPGQNANMRLTTSQKGFHVRSEDKPPRVPSPPPLPSLAQMNWEQTNPEDYANYRSPTYSIYGLYESDRARSVLNIKHSH